MVIKGFKMLTCKILPHFKWTRISCSSKTNLIHLLLFVIYKLLLQKETQVVWLRRYLLGATILAMILPLINIPISSPIQPINVAESVSTIILPEFTIATTPAEQSWFATLSWLNWFFIITSLIVGIRFIIALVRILIIYSKSEPCLIYNYKVRHATGLETIFTFFSWIFVDKNNPANTQEIIHHEEAHIKYAHSYDLVLLNILAVPFWWLPSIWLTIKELKQLHEYQADQFALSSNSYKNYARTLINYTLTRQGLMLTNSFNDTPLTKRLAFMKQLKKKISPWKTVSVLLVLSMTIYTFSCQEMTTQELDKQVIEEQIAADNDIFQVVDNPPEFPGGITEFYNYVGSSLKYTDKALKEKISGKIFVEMVINTDGTVGNVTVLKGIGSGLDEEAKRVVANSPTWTPGSHKEHKVRVKMVLPITFRHPDYPELEEIPLIQEKSHTSGDLDNSKLVEVPIDKMPEYPDGIKNFYKYVQENLKYPEEAKKMGLEGKVFVQFKVNTDGSISNVRINRGIGASCDEEAKRIVENSQNWLPMEADGKAMAMTMVIPIEFRLK